MACDDDIIAETALVSAIAGPLKVSGDAGSVEQHSLSELIAADKYLRSRCAASSGNRFFGIPIAQAKPPGAV